MRDKSDWGESWKSSACPPLPPLLWGACSEFLWLPLCIFTLSPHVHSCFSFFIEDVTCLFVKITGERDTLLLWFVSTCEQIDPPSPWHFIYIHSFFPFFNLFFLLLVFTDHSNQCRRMDLNGLCFLSLQQFQIIEATFLCMRITLKSLCGLKKK